MLIPSNLLYRQTEQGLVLSQTDALFPTKSVGLPNDLHYLGPKLRLCEGCQGDSVTTALSLEVLAAAIKTHRQRMVRNTDTWERRAMWHWSGLLVLGACVKAAPPGVPTPQDQTATEVVQGARVGEKITVRNPTPHTIDVSVTASAPDQEDEVVTFGPIASGEEGAGSIDVWTHGAFTVVASWKIDGSVIRSQPYTAMLDPAEPVTPVTLTLNSPYESGTLGVWSNVEWEIPPGMETE